MTGVTFEADIVTCKGCIMYHFLDKSLILLNMTVLYTGFKIHHLFHTNTNCISITIFSLSMMLMELVMLMMT